MPDAGSEERFSAALAAIAEACEAGRQEAAAAPDLVEAFRRATRLLEAINGERGMMARWRARMARRLWRTERLSLAGLGRKLGMSKARAAQIAESAGPLLREEEG